jgi:NAD+ synthase
MADQKDSLYRKLADDISAWISGRVAAAGADGAVLGLSGGVDSAVVAFLAARALGGDRVLAVNMPCGSDPLDEKLAAVAAEAAGVGFRVSPLDEPHASLVRACDLEDAPRMVRANIKPRLRMTVLYALSRGRLVLGSGNYSESLVGYSTKWGDGAADLAPLARLYKDEVVSLATVLGVPPGIVSRPPTAGLWAGQTDEGEMGFTYPDLRRRFEGSGVDPAVAARIDSLNRAGAHKREPIPIFEAREWFETHG